MVARMKMRKDLAIEGALNGIDSGVAALHMQAVHGMQTREQSFY